MPPQASSDYEEIDLLRGGQIVSSLTGAFGHSLKETRLTAVLGYLIARNPKRFLELFGFRGVPQRVSLETHHRDGRSDIFIETTSGTGIIEAKVNAIDPLIQSNRYPARWRVLITHRVPPAIISRGPRYLSWNKIGVLLDELSKHGSAEQRVLSRDLLDYMQGHHMTRMKKSVEIYAREINEPITLALFLKAQLYGCDYQASSPLAEALYFAPHFGKVITQEHPGVNVGISYIARIKSVVHATTWQDFRKLMHEERGSSWWKRYNSLLRGIHREWTWNKGQHRSFLMLGKPRLVFNPPVRKERLQKGRGWLSKRFFSFDDLFAARE